jgi:hypothetical protein
MRSWLGDLVKDVLYAARSLRGNLALLQPMTQQDQFDAGISEERLVEVLWMILRESLPICSIGLIVGLPLSIASARLLSSLLYGLPPDDALTICVAISFVASLFPATRAASVDPIVALRYE